MKNKYVIMAAALLISISTFAQKEQIKAAEKALKNSNAVEAKKILTDAEPLIANATEEEKAQFYSVKGNVYLQLAKSNVDSGKNYSEALKAYQVVFDTEKKSGKSKYSKPAEVQKLLVINGLKSAAYEDYKNKNFKGASDKYYELYQSDNTQTDFLYNASNAALGAKEYDLALTYLEELKRINYSGETTYFIAVSKVNGREDFYSTKKERDAAVSLGTHEKPTDELVPSKRGEIYRNIALILIQKGQIEEAKKAIQEARIANPNDDSLILSEADLYLKTKDIDTYKKLITEVLEKNPNNFELIFNLGVVSYTNKDFVNAEKYYLRVIELNPNYANAYFNMSALKIDQATTMLDNMNKLSTSAADNKKYDAMKKERDALLVVIQGYLEKTIALDDSNIDAKQALVTVYNALEMSAKAKALKENIKAQESKQ